MTGVVRERARAEAREIVAMLDYRDAELQRIAASDESPMRRHVERGSVALTIGEASGMSEGQVQYRLSFADTVRDQSPTTWGAFLDGRIDLARVREIGSTIDQLKRTESVHRLDQRVVAYAETHTVAELRAWLKAFVRRVEADLAIGRAEDERAKRYVSVKHGDDSMGWLSAYLPSHELAAIEDRYRKAARRITDPDDERTLAQREADLLVAWCTESDAASSAIDANIAVTVGADVLAGFTPGFAESSDGRWGVPAAWIAAVVGSGSTFWHRIVVDPVNDDVLAHEYIGRLAPDILKIALQFLHGTCQGPGCMVPAKFCDYDHRIPFPEGPTAGDNLGPLCRRHHGYKGHGLLHWTTRPRPERPAV
nr:HNH endonuclease signature motif containing protein [Aeromicrobium sp. CFBP 8757]